MLLLETHLPITLEVLDARGNAISGMAAKLCHLDGEKGITDQILERFPLLLTYEPQKSPMVACSKEHQPA